MRCVRKNGEERERGGEDEDREARKEREQLALRLMAAAAAAVAFPPAVPPRSLTPDPSGRVKGEKREDLTGENAVAESAKIIMAMNVPTLLRQEDMAF